MSNFHLRLSDYFFIHQFVEPNHLFDSSRPAEFTHRVSCFIRKNGETNTINLNVKVELDESESKNFSYRYKLEVYGIFEPNDKEKSDEFFLGVARTQGASLLISAIRERLSLLTATGPFPNCVLDFVPLDSVAYYSQKIEKEAEVITEQPKKRAISPKRTVAPKTTRKKPAN